MKPVIRLALLLLLLGSRAAAADDITLGYIPSITAVSAYVADADGIFARNGLRVTMVPVVQGSNAVAAIVSGSMQVAMSLPTNFIQAAAGGLDIVVVANSHIYPTPNEVGVLVPAASPAQSLADLAGRRIGVNGLEGIQHMLLLRALADAGVETWRINFIEVAFAQMPDALKTRTVDAVTISEPFSQRAVLSGVARRLADLQTQIPPGTLGTVYITTRAWADANPTTLAALRAALGEAVEAVRADPGRARQMVGQKLKFGPDVISLIHVPNVATHAAPAQIEFWIDLLRRTGFLTTAVSAEQLIYPWPEDP